MKKLFVFLLVSVFLVSFADISSATNGDNMIGVSAASRGMGGIGVGMPVGPTDSIFRNPSWMNNYEGSNVSFGGILFLPKVKGRFSHPSLGDSGYEKSDADTFVVPEIGVVTQINDKLHFGIGAFGVSGMGVDYKDQDPRLSDMHTNFQFMRIIPALSYKVNDSLSLSGGIHVAWGSLDMGAIMCDPTMTTCWNAGGGQSQSLGVGGQLGVSYKINKLISVGATYQTPVSMKYKRLFDTDGDGEYESLRLDQPQEIAVGIGFNPANNIKVGFDVRWIDWSNADGYGDFKWKDQWVFAIGGEYKPVPALAFRAGWNYAKSPIRGESNLNVMNANAIPDFDAGFSDFNVAFFNLVGFPAITEHHVTVGLGYEFTKKFSVDLAYKYAFEKEVESSAMGGTLLAGAKNSQNALSIGLNWKF